MKAGTDAKRPAFWALMKAKSVRSQSEITQLPNIASARPTLLNSHLDLWMGKVEQPVSMSLMT